jgi:hypothetical protein
MQEKARRLCGGSQKSRVKKINYSKIGSEKNNYSVLLFLPEIR